MGGFSRVPKKHYRYRKNSSRGSGGRSSSFDTAVLGLALVVGIIAAIGKVLLIALPIIIIGALIYSSVINAQQAEQAKAAEEEQKRKEEERKAEEKRKELEWIKQPEPSFINRRMPAVYSYPKEEGRVGNGYVEYLKEKDNVDRLEQHIKWIDDYNSICRRHSVLDAKDFSEDRRKSTSELSLSRQRLNSLKYEPLFQLDSRVSGIKMAYEKLQNALKKAQRENYSYTQDAYGYFDKSSAMENDNYFSKGIYFTTPWYVIAVINKYPSSISLFKYEDVSADMWCDEEEVYYATYNDDVARVEWEHARKDGGPDLRYTDNEKTTYVYRGRVKLSFGSSTNDNELTLKFQNKRFSQEFCVAWKEYANLLKKRENSAIVNAVLNNSSKSLDDYYKKKERNKSNKEKQKRKKEEYVDGLKPGMVLTHKTLGKGKLVSIDEGYMTVNINGENKKFKYPDAIKNGFFIIS